MTTKRAFSSDDVRLKKDDYFGSATFVGIPAAVAAAGLKSMNLELTFEEALKLSLALSTCVQQLNRYNRNTTEGRDRGALLAIKIETRTISVIERKTAATKGKRAPKSKPSRAA